jgi:hypothetical protein
MFLYVQLDPGKERSSPVRSTQGEIDTSCRWFFYLPGFVLMMSVLQTTEVYKGRSAMRNVALGQEAAPVVRGLMIVMHQEYSLVQLDRGNACDP